METSFPTIASPDVSRALNDAQAVAQASVAPFGQTAMEREAAQESMQRRVDQFRHAEVKREIAPMSLGALSGAIAAILAFTSQKERELLNVIRNLRGDARMAQKGAEKTINPADIKLDNERLNTLVKLYDDHEKQYDLLRREIIGPDASGKLEKPLRQNLGEWLQHEYRELKQRDNVSINETLDKKFNRYKKDTIAVFEKVNADVKAYAEKHGIPFKENTQRFGEESATLVEILNARKGDLKDADAHMGKIANMYERAYIKITSARQEYRTAIDREVLLKIRQMGKRIGFNELTQGAKTRSFLTAGVWGAAIAGAIYALIKFITKESASERAEREQLQATKEWERARQEAAAKTQHAPEVPEFAQNFGGPQLQELLQRSSQSHAERLANSAITEPESGLSR